MRQEIKGFNAVKEAAKDFETYSSDLLGDRDVRTYRQLPLEADPPRHTKFREAVQPYFMASRLEQFRPRFEELARTLIHQTQPFEVTKDLALPYVMGCLGIIFNRPQDVEEWLSWGPDVWTAESYMNGHHDESATRAHQDRDFSVESSRSGKVLHNYLDRVFNVAVERARQELPEQDLWDFVARVEIDGVRVSRDEMFGIAGVLLAGGRDTVVKLISGLVWHLVQSENDRTFLAQNPSWYSRTIAEFVRFLSPLPKMERAPREQAVLPDSDRDVNQYVLLNFVSANHDREIWPDADQLDIHRDRKPHLAFGFGRHSCLGMNVTEVEVSSFLTVLTNEWPSWKFEETPQIVWVEETDKDGFPFKYIEKFSEITVFTGE
jgi:cytochrome P450